MGMGCFSKSVRLVKAEQFSQVFTTRRALKSMNFVLHYRLRQDDGMGARLGLVVGKRQLKQAVARNLVKRIARENFRLMHNRMPAVDIVLRLNKKLESGLSVAQHKQLAQEISALFSKVIAVDCQIARSLKME